MCSVSQKYDRRSCRVTESEQEMWQDVTPTMMSDEEDVGENTFRIHRQEWRSPKMTHLLEELDTRADIATKKVHPRKNRVIGTPLKTNAPSATRVDAEHRKCGHHNRELSPPIL